jgi:hypothetical protein
MRNYGKRFLKNYLQSKISGASETRDAILYDVLPAQRLCRVKIQGTTEKIVAHYPENWEQTPFWLKPGNAVRITHAKGIRGRIELVSHGQTVPTPQPDDTEPQFPARATSADAILTGCKVRSVPNNPRMAVQVTIGTYRIGGVEYTLGPIKMLYGDDFVMGDGGRMSEVAGSLAINAAPSSGYYRYDLISVGIDGVIHYTAGTAATSDPVKPTPAANHLALKYILVPSGTTQILPSNLGKQWTAPFSTHVTVVPADTDLAWGELTTTVRVSVVDQYGNLLASTGSGWYITLEIVNGNGTLHSDETGDSTTIVHQHLGAASYYDFIYTRNGTVDDVSPLLKASLGVGTSRYAFASITLRDSDGDPM